MSESNVRPVSKCAELFDLGEPLTDAEVLSLRDAYARAGDACAELGATYSVITRDAMHRRSQLDSICTSRGLRRETDDRNA